MTDDDRIYQDPDGCWYYRMRGNQTRGPFASRIDAAMALKAQLRAFERPPPEPKKPRRVWNPRTWLRHSEPRHG